MENLQTEIQEMEFFQFSKGLSFMRKEDFAEWLLLFTNTENKDVYWKNVRERLSAGEVSMPFHYACDGQEVGSPTSLLSSQVAPTWTRTKPPRVSELGSGGRVLPTYRLPGPDCCLRHTRCGSRKLSISGKGRKGQGSTSQCKRQGARVFGRERRWPWASSVYDVTVRLENTRCKVRNR